MEPEDQDNFEKLLHDLRHKYDPDNRQGEIIGIRRPSQVANLALQHIAREAAAYECIHPKAIQSCIDSMELQMMGIKP